MCRRATLIVSQNVVPAEESESPTQQQNDHDGPNAEPGAGIAVILAPLPMAIVANAAAEEQNYQNDYQDHAITSQV